MKKVIAIQKRNCFSRMFSSLYIQKCRRKATKLIPIGYNILFLSIWIIPLGIFCVYNAKLESLISILGTYTLEVGSFTFFQAFISSLAALLLALIPAVYISRSASILSVVTESTVFIPFFFPAVSTVIAFSIIGNLPGIKSLGLLYSLSIIVIANVFFNAPIFVKYIGEALRRISPELLESAAIEGAGKIRIFYSIKLPLVFPSIVKAFFICFAFCFTNFAIVLGLGGIRFSTLEVEIATTLSSSMDMSRALGYGIIQFIILSAMSLVSVRAPVYEGKTVSSAPGKSSVFTVVFSFIYVFFEYFVVFTGLIFAFYNFYTGKFDFSGFTTLFSLSFNSYYPVIVSIINSFILSSLTAFIVLAIVYFMLKCHSIFTDWIVLSVCGVSNAFLGIALVYMNILYRIPYPVLVVCGYVTISAPIAYSFLYQHIKGFPVEIIEASRIDGAGAFQIFRYIELPILLPVFITVFIQVFAIAFGEFTIAYTMQIFNYIPTVPVVDYALLSNRRVVESSMLNAISILIIITLFVTSELCRRFYSKRAL